MLTDRTAIIDRYRCHPYTREVTLDTLSRALTRILKIGVPSLGKVGVKTEKLEFHPKKTWSFSSFLSQHGSCDTLILLYC